jgi:urease accessory protein
VSDGKGWAARLALKVERQGEHTRPVLREHEGPLRLQKMLYPEGPGVCHAIVLHPPGGVVGGDTLDIQINVGPQAHLFCTSPGASKWYRSGAIASEQSITLSVDCGGILEWLPQEAIVFDQVNTQWSTKVVLADHSSVAMGLEVIMLGRAASAETFLRGSLKNKLVVSRADQVLFNEQWVLNGADPRLSSLQGLNGNACFGQLWAHATPAQMQQAYQACLGDSAGAASVTYLPDRLLIARAVGSGPEMVRHDLLGVWKKIRALMTSVEPTHARIWLT